jgi:DNA-binding PadR family transcriptional regulator
MNHFATERCYSEVFPLVAERNIPSLIRQNESAVTTVLVDGSAREASEVKSSWKIGFLDLQILSLLSSQPMTGYCLRKNLHLRFGTWTSFGTLYPHLKFLEKIQVLSSSSKTRSPTSAEVITYELTEKGSADLKKGLISFQDSIRIVEELVRSSGN